MNHLDGLISNFSSAIVWLGKAWETYRAAENIQKCYRDDKISTTQKVAKMSTGVIFIAAQTVEMGTHGAGCAPKIKMATKVTAGVAGVANQIAQDGLNEDTVKYVLYRSSDVLEGALENNCLPNHNSQIKKTLSVAAATNVLYTNRKSIMSASKRGYEIAEAMIERSKAKFKSPLSSLNQSKPCTASGTSDRPNFNRNDDIPTQSGSSDTAASNPNENGEESCSTGDSLEAKREALAMVEDEIKEIKESSLIPEGYYKTFEEFICPITHKPIRYVVTLNIIDNEDDEEDYYYEKEAIMQFVQETPNQVPEKWPIDLLPLPLKLEYIQPCVKIQKLINKRLRSLCRYLQEEIHKLKQEINAIESANKN